MSSSHHEYVVSNLPLGVRFYQSDVTTSGYVPFHWHNSIEALLVLNGELTVTMNRKTTSITNNEFIIISSGVIHDVRNTPNQALVLQIPLQIFDPYVAKPEEILFDMSRPISTKLKKQIIAQLLKINQAVYEKPTGYLFDAEIALTEFLKLIVLNLGEEGKNVFSNVGSNLKNLLVYIDSHYREEISIQQMARQSGYNASYLSRLFKKNMGITLTEYIYEIRLSRFYDDLLETDKPINELMDRHGLTNRRTSREQFKKMYGILPHEVRKNRSR